MPPFSTILTWRGLVLPVALISLPDATNRRELLRARAIPQDWYDPYFSAIDLREASSDIDLELGDQSVLIKRYRKRLRPSDIGCAMSHKKLAELFSNTNLPMMLILEDDIVPMEINYIDEIKSIADMYSSLAEKGSAFVVNLGPNRFDPRTVRKRRVVSAHGQPRSHYMLASERGYVPGSQAYLISRTAALRSTQIETKVMSLADDWAHRVSLSLLDYVFFCDPPLIAQDQDLESTLTGVAIPYSDYPRGFRSRAVAHLQKRGIVGSATYVLRQQTFRIQERIKALKPFRLPAPLE